MSPLSDGLRLLVAVLYVVVPIVSGWDQSQDRCGRCWIESDPDEQCNITGIDDKEKNALLPRSHCYISAPKLQVKVVPVEDCKRLTFNVSITPPKEGMECLVGFRLTISYHESQEFLFAYNIKLRNGNWSRFGKQMVLQFQIPDREKSTCAPTVFGGDKCFFKLQPVPGKSMMIRSIREDVFAYKTVSLPEWELGKWNTTVNYEVQADGVRAWFDVPPEPECFCLRRFKFMLVSNKTEREVDYIIVSYPHNEGVFSKVQEGTYQIHVLAWEENDECKGPCKPSRTDWFAYPEATATPLITSSSNGARTVPNQKTTSYPPWINPTIGGTIGTIAAVVVLVIAAVIIYKGVKDPETKLTVIVLYHGSRNSDAALQHLKSLLEKGTRFVCRLVDLSKPQNRTCPDKVINMSAIILIVCSRQTADNFLETPSWPKNAAHENILSTLLVPSNKRKRVLVKWNPDWGPNKQSNLLDWMKFSDRTTQPLTGDTEGKEFLNAITDVVKESSCERPDETEMGRLMSSRGELQLAGSDEDETMSRMMPAHSDPLLSHHR